MDTGYSLGHEDLPSGSNVTGDDNDGNGNDTGNWYEDGHGHGTHVSGTIAAVGNNGTGVVGVNPSGNLNLHMVKVFNNSGSWAYGSDLVIAVDQCRAAGAKVISMSLGGSLSSNAEQAAFDDAAAAGVLSIAAAGNDGNSSHSYPASYDAV
ncbi:MAG: S8 family serine peptidase, partial [Kangiellaceae bacterium]|nr:S8 family serine peptidase [Kangiellaceae bacterium]